ncbi:hypothetical protein DFJ74DRAFT_668894 [Hyaloraphidium curvatum]|nr:hypothetical protein DFJ74DRAFT_668894 [Hyaloraphidium curvatum]
MELLEPSEFDLRLLWTALRGARGLISFHLLHHCDLRTMSHFGLDAGPYLPLLRHLDSLDSLREISLATKYAWIWRLPDESQLFSWPDALLRFSRLPSLLVRLTTSHKLDPWLRTNRFCNVEDLHFFNEEVEDMDKLRRICASFPRLRSLEFSQTEQPAGTAILADFSSIRFHCLEQLTIRYCYLGLNPMLFPAVKTAIEESGVRITLEPLWECLNWETLESAQALKAEEDFWLGVPGVHFDAYGAHSREGFDPWQEEFERYASTSE